MTRLRWHPLVRPLLLLAWAAGSLSSLAGQTPTPNPAGNRGILQDLNGAVSQIMAQVAPAVVQIRVTGLGVAETSERTEAAFIERRHSLGSGLIVDPSGFILTNEHVVHGAQRIRVLLPVVPGPHASGADPFRHRSFDATVVGTQADVDLALLKIEATGLPALSLNKVSQARQGGLVFAIGSPEGLASSVTLGIISAAERQVENAFPIMFIQTDAPINPGNSGGPLVDAEGALVGINAFILTRSGGSEGLGFAIPAATVKFVYESLRQYGRVKKIETGLTTQAITPVLAAGLNLPRDWGVIVSDLDPKGPARTAGVEPGDIVEAFDGRPIESLPALTSAAFLHPVDQPVLLQVLRGDRRLTLTVRATEAPRPPVQLSELASASSGLVRRLGVVGADLDDKTRGLVPHLRSTAGVVVGARIQDVTSVGTGLRAGDVIRALNRTPIESLATLKEELRSLKPGDAVALQIEREGKLTYLAFEME